MVQEIYIYIVFLLTVDHNREMFSVACWLTVSTWIKFFVSAAILVDYEGRVFSLWKNVNLFCIMYSFYFIFSFVKDAHFETPFANVITGYKCYCLV